MSTSFQSEAKDFNEEMKLTQNTAYEPVVKTDTSTEKDFLEGSTFPPYAKSKSSINRDMLVVMKSSKIVDIFEDVFTNDWNVETPWEPKLKTWFLLSVDTI